MFLQLFNGFLIGNSFRSSPHSTAECLWVTVWDLNIFELFLWYVFFGWDPWPKLLCMPKCNQWLGKYLCFPTCVNGLNIVINHYWYWLDMTLSTCRVPPELCLRQWRPTSSAVAAVVWAMSYHKRSASARDLGYKLFSDLCEVVCTGPNNIFWLHCHWADFHLSFWWTSQTCVHRFLSMTISSVILIITSWVLSSVGVWVQKFMVSSNQSNFNKVHSMDGANSTCRAAFVPISGRLVCLMGFWKKNGHITMTMKRSPGSVLLQQQLILLTSLHSFWMFHQESG